MKIQLDSLELDTTKIRRTSGDYCPLSMIAQIHIRWAIDSLGNGFFKSMTGIQKPAQNAHSPLIKKKSSYLKINSFRRNNIAHVDELFDTQGKHFSKTIGQGIFFKPKAP